MRSLTPCLILVPLLLHGCASVPEKDTLASLKDVKLDIKEEKIKGSLDKAMESYRKFLEETPETAMTPEAIRRLADLKVEKEYGVLEDSDVVKDAGEARSQAGAGAKPAAPAANGAATPPVPAVGKIKESEKSSTASKSSAKDKSAGPIADLSESQKDFEKRASGKQTFKAAKKEPAAAPNAKAAAELQTAGAMEAIELYKSLLVKYPLYERNDQVLYQLSRAYEETGQIEKAIKILNRLVKDYPNSRHYDEAQFRRAEYFFTRKKYLDAEDAYGAVIKMGVSSAFYELAIYKQGWTFFKQELYEESLNDFIALLDYKVSIGFDFDNVQNKIEKKRLDDTFRVISLAFSYLGGPKAIVAYFEKNGSRSYEPSIYSHLGEYYLDKRRYADAADSYNTFVERNPINKVSPYFQMRVIEIYLKGGFPKLVIDAKKAFANTYDLGANYWSFFDINENPKVLAFLKTNLNDLATHYHALYQDKRLVKKKPENFKEAVHWYRKFLDSFPEDEQAPTLNFQLAELFLENKSYREAALEYERTSYNYPPHQKSAEAGYAAVYSYREYLKTVDQSQRVIVKREIIRSSLRFADTYPKNKNAVTVLVAATDDLFALKDYEQAIKTGRKVIHNYPNADKKLLRSAWLVVAHSSFSLTNYVDAEHAYTEVLKLTSKKDKSYKELTENLAASVYKQGEQARLLKDYKTASYHFLRVGQVAPNSKIRPTAEYDAAAALITLKDWDKAAQVLEAFRKNYPKNKYQADVTRKLAVVYKEKGDFLKSAAEFERIEKETDDEELRRESLNQAAELYEKAKDQDRALAVYLRFVSYFPKPVEPAVETRHKIAEIYKAKDDHKNYFKQLEAIVKADRQAGKQRTDRTRFLAAKAGLVLVESEYQRFIALKLTMPFKKNLRKKKNMMKQLIRRFTNLVDYEVGEVTAAATYYIAEVYYNFSRSLMQSERPKKLSPLELEQYNLVLEEQAYPFEEKAIKVHEKNMELLGAGVYNDWIDKSLAKLAVLMPARYAKPEQESSYAETILPKAAVPAVPPAKTDTPEPKPNQQALNQQQVNQ